ncbi:unnamed protein product, partial [Dicrocoelium dendriticum]
MGTEGVNAMRMQYAPTFKRVLRLGDPPAFIALTPGLTHISFTTEALLQNLTTLRKHKSPSVDTICPEALGAAVVQVAEPLAQFFQRCLDHKRVPAARNLKMITPTHKDGSTTEASNYCPLSLLPIFSKMMEFIIADALVGYLEKKAPCVRRSAGK